MLRRCLIAMAGLGLWEARSDSRPCTMMACSESLELSWSDSLPAFQVRLRASTDTAVITVECRPGDPEGQRGPGAWSSECSPRGLKVQVDPMGNRKRDTLDVKVTGPQGEIRFAGRVRLAWKGAYYPNGKRCDKYPCQRAKARLSLSRLP